MLNALFYVVTKQSIAVCYKRVILAFNDLFNDSVVLYDPSNFSGFGEFFHALFNWMLELQWQTQTQGPVALAIYLASFVLSKLTS